jgi:glycosyltransferase involved in cell wall biosynthesis
LKVLFPFVGDSVGGSHNSVLELYYCLEKTNITPIILIHNKGPLSNLLDNLQIQYVFFPVKKLAGESPNIIKVFFGIFSNFFKIQKFLKINEINIVHGNDLRINLTWSFPTRVLRRKYVWHQRTTMSNSLLWKLSYLLSDHIVAISKHVFQSLPSNISSSKKSLVLNPFNIEIFYDKKDSRKWVNDLYSLPEKKILFGYIGRLISWKNIDTLIQYFSNFIINTNQPVHLLIVGTGSNDYVDKLKNIVIKLGLNNKVTFAGFTSEPLRVIASFDLLISSSNNEPFGRTIIEAMIQKTPVLAAYGGGHNETITPGQTGFLYRHESSDDFTKQCDLNINNAIQRDAMIINAHNIACSKYSSIKHSNSILDIYKSLIAQ